MIPPKPRITSMLSDDDKEYLRARTEVIMKALTPEQKNDIMALTDPAGVVREAYKNQPHGAELIDKYIEILVGIMVKGEIDTGHPYPPDQLVVGVGRAYQMLTATAPQRGLQ